MAAVRSLYRFLLSPLIILISGTIVLMVLILFNEYNILLAHQKNTMRNVVQTVTSILNSKHSDVMAGKISILAAQKQAMDELKSVRYNYQDYLWIHSPEGTVLMHPYYPATVGKNLANDTDPDGKKYMAEMLTVVRTNPTDGGYVEYKWAAPHTPNPISKISYVYMYKPWGWVIGTGAYYDAIHRQLMHTSFKLLLAVLTVIIFLMIAPVTLVQKINSKPTYDEITEN